MAAFAAAALGQAGFGGGAGGVGGGLASILGRAPGAGLMIADDDDDDKVGGGTPETILAEINELR